MIHFPAGLLSLTSFLTLNSTALSQHRAADISFDPGIRREIGGISEFDRKKFITIHAGSGESDWVGEEDKLKHLVDDLDVYFGRHTGAITWTLSQMKEDPANKGHVHFPFMEMYARQERARYQSQSHLHPYAERDDLIVATQLHPFWPDGALITPPDGSAPWSIANAAASGQAMGYWLNMFTGGDGPPRPRYFEIVNEPVYELQKENKDASLRQIWEYHRDAAKAIRRLNQDVLIGGYTAAFPDVEKDDFREWHERWKDFIDVTGDSMDFYSLHLYDFPGINHGQQMYRKGAHLEGTLDMIEHYATLKFGKPKPFVISEYGSQLHDWFNQPWSPNRDWLCLKAINSMLLQFMTRPDQIAKTIPFITVKAEWGNNEGGSGFPYYWRLLRKENEPQSFTGDYVFSDQIKFYQLWSEVRGTRILTHSSDPNLLADAYADGNKLHLIINNLTTAPSLLNLQPADVPGNAITRTHIRHLYPTTEGPRLDAYERTQESAALGLGSESTMILSFIYEKPLAQSSTVDERKYYATSHFHPITADQPVDYTIAKVQPGQNGKATLRLGVGRAHGKKLTPTITFNGEILRAPGFYRGRDQTDRPSFFGIYEIPVSPDLIKAENKVTITFPDTGGHLSSLALQILN
ncbi:agarase [Haloferula chungangensis]|uniref:Agarase n=1 Tax=Haloferula chungangensis TaxID=1048331 RepID=A0ABW2LAW5_9BACT